MAALRKRTFMMRLTFDELIRKWQCSKMEDVVVEELFYGEEKERLKKKIKWKGGKCRLSSAAPALSTNAKWRCTPSLHG